MPELKRLNLMPSLLFININRFTSVHILSVFAVLTKPRGHSSFSFRRLTVVSVFR